MNSWWYHVLDLLKIVLPLLLFYFLFTRTIKSQSRSIRNILQSKISEQRSSHQLKLRLQALERMALYIERIDLQSMVYRFHQAKMSVRELYYTMLIALQEELEHNITQQLYVSDRLWEIIKTVRDHQINLLSNLKEGLNDNDEAIKLIEKINWYIGSQNDEALNTARKAIKEETKILL